MKELSEAMLKVFAEIPKVKKDKVNPFFDSKYADLDGIISAIKPVLAKHGIWFHQCCSKSDTDAVVETVIHHKSGQVLPCGEISVPYILESYDKELKRDIVRKNPHTYGSAFTYARRYSLSAAFGISPEDDDDGNGAKGNGKTDYKNLPNCPNCQTRLYKKKDDDSYFCWKNPSKDKNGCGMEFNSDLKPLNQVTNEVDKTKTGNGNNDKSDVEKYLDTLPEGVKSTIKGFFSDNKFTLGECREFLAKESWNMELIVKEIEESKVAKVKEMFDGEVK